MRRISYAGETVITTDEVAEVLIALTATVASFREAEAVTIPIVREDGSVGHAELVIGVGNDLLSAPADWEGAVPDFSADAARLREHRHFPRHADVDEESDSVEEDPIPWDPDLDGATG